MSLTHKDAEKREENIKRSCNATVSPRPCPSCSCLFLPFLCMYSGSALRGLLKFWALWWRADGWYLEDNQDIMKRGTLGHALIRELLSCQPPVQAHSQCCPQLKDLESSLPATAWRIMVSPSTRHLHCLTHHTSNWSSHWLNSTTGWYFSSRCSPAGWLHY